MDEKEFQKLTTCRFKRLSDRIETCITFADIAVLCSVVAAIVGVVF